MINIVSEKNVMNGQIVTKQQIYELLKHDVNKLYEVIRVINKKPVFLREHFDRLNESIRLSNINDRLDYEYFKDSVNILIEQNKFENCNIRISYLHIDNPIVLMYFIKSSYPSEELFKTGIYAVTVKKHRNNPNIKHLEENFKDDIDNILNRTKAFEAVLINDDNTVSEGSKSNIFFVKSNKLITSDDSSVLLGVTRCKIIKVCDENNITVEKRNVYFHELKDFDGAFITGTSNNVLPIRLLDNIEYNSSNNELIMKVSDLYLNEMNNELG